MSILSNEELRQKLTVTIPPKAPHALSRKQKDENFKTFCNLSRENLTYNKKERRILMYETQKGEKIYYQYPGKESIRDSKKIFNLDARPILIKSNKEQHKDMDFNEIWDIIDSLGKQHQADTDILGVVFLRIAYMYHYAHESRDFVYEEIDYESNSKKLPGTLKMEWNRLFLDNDVIETLNDRFKLPDEYDFSFEAFLYYNDILAQNEDIKYYSPTAKKNDKGRINNCLSHLTVISHIREKMTISELINRFQKGRGVGPLPQKYFNDVCDKLVIKQK